MSTNLCLVLLLQLAGSQVPKFHYQLTKESLKEVPEKGRTSFNLADGVTSSAQLYALYTDRAHSFNQ